MLRKFLTLFTLALAVNAILMSCIWAHHMFVTGLNPFLGSIFVLLTLLLLIPITIFAGKRITRLLKRTVGLSPAILFIFGALLILTIHLIVAVFFDISPFGASHVLTLCLLELLFLALAAAYYVFPIIAHHTLNPTLGYVHFWITLICAYLLTFHRYSIINNTEFILLAAQSLFLINLFYSTRRA